MISIAELKQLIYRESGYKIQVQDNDPIFAAFYVNIATLGEALKHAESIQAATNMAISSLPDVADRVMQKAGEKALSTLSAEVGCIAQRIAGNTVAAEKAKAISTATKLVTIGLIICGFVFGLVGYLLCRSIDKLEINFAQEQVKEAKKQVNQTIEEAIKNAAWVETTNGKSAYLFYKNEWPKFTSCNMDFMEKVGKNGCRMKQKYGWLGGNESPIWQVSSKAH